MSGSVRTGWVRDCACGHLAPLLDHLRPHGSLRWAVREVFPDTSLPGGIKEAAGISWTSPDRCGMLAVGHCKGLGLASPLAAATALAAGAVANDMDTNAPAAHSLN
jgi:hypothetical protein